MLVLSNSLIPNKSTKEERRESKYIKSTNPTSATLLTSFSQFWDKYKHHFTFYVHCHSKIHLITLYTSMKHVITSTARNSIIIYCSLQRALFLRRFHNTSGFTRSTIRFKLWLFQAKTLRATTIPGRSSSIPSMFPLSRLRPR